MASGRSNAELAAYFGVTESGILQAKRMAGLAKPMLDHGRALPWKLNRAHNQSGPATNLRNLSAIAQGGQVPQTKINTALRWARRLTESGLDVGYSYEDGFYERPVEGASHIEAVLTAALTSLNERGEGERADEGA
ncbi:hypothetical protein Ssi03_41960 [Sphaerisporangium siamense]|uniref:Uncharacterized protein n=1 Tax=Sphaerisporangium siamense TaxID=795645 RepID=A0A7W7DD25_9ACTN|nr:hypothetical protein [Sphaerisporangium siamense]MBB4704592.1 hypothetical protein [Sphaerisporangium siamense]GII86206.1 hypothetical protein Ssi03_41960 [Sphaerisporangium siamense]